MVVTVRLMTAEPRYSSSSEPQVFFPENSHAHQPQNEEWIAFYLIIMVCYVIIILLF
jgi:hypothetical protein